MSEAQENKIRRFINDPMMSDSVYEVLQWAFLKRHVGPVDVQVLAAERLAMDFLGDAWRKLDEYKTNNENVSESSGNVGL
jgi:hypothetical protein